MKTLERLLNKKMSRKQFLMTLGLGMAGVMGLPAMLKMLDGGVVSAAPKGKAVGQADDWKWLVQEYAKYSNKKLALPTGDALCRLPAFEQLALLSRKKDRISAVALTQAHLERINTRNPQLNAFVHLTPDKALEAAAVAETRYQNGTPRALEGLTFAIKDLFDFWAGVPNTFGSKPMKDFGFVPPFTAIYIQRALDAGVVPLGKTNTPEFGHKGITDNLVYGPTSTPFDTRFNAGGSSGGSAAAVAGFMTALTQGSDAGGSVRIPAAMCGIVAHKPSVGRWPQDAPPLAYAPFFTAGPMARTVADTAMLMEVVGGHSAGDPLSMDSAPNYIEAFRNGVSGDKPLQGKKIAYSPDMDIFPVQSAVTQVVGAALQAFRDAGATVEEVHLGFDEIVLSDVGGTNRRPLTSQEFGDMWVKMQSGLYGHARDLFLEFGIPLDLRDHLSELTPEFAAMLNASAGMSAEEYRHLDFLRADVLHKLNHVLESYDYIVTPTLATVAVRNATGGNTLGPTSVNGQAVDPQIGWCLTYPVNFSGHPAMSVPAGLAPNPLGGNKLPVGLQIIGRMQADAAVFTAAAAFEKKRPWYEQLPV